MTKKTKVIEDWNKPTFLVTFIICTQIDDFHEAEEYKTLLIEAETLKDVFNNFKEPNNPEIISISKIYG